MMKGNQQLTLGLLFSAFREVDTRVGRPAGNNLTNKPASQENSVIKDIDDDK
jgi:hypothetical protein